jgi:myo-inositol-1(or 4)-monophosphatase
VNEIRESREAKWLALCRRAVERQRDVLGGYGPSDVSAAFGGAGAGGDTTLRIDHDFERIVIDEIERIEHDPPRAVISEEVGELACSRSGTDFVLIDPVDGSKNAALGLPQFSLSVAVADGRTMADVWFGYVYDFGTGEEFATLGEGPPLCNGRPVAPGGSTSCVIGCESAEPELLGRGLLSLAGTPVDEIRVVGSIAISLSYVGLGRLAGFFTCKDCRSVDAAAAQLIARRSGVEVLFDGESARNASLDLSSRYRLVAGHQPLVADLLAAQTSIPHVPR